MKSKEDILEIIANAKEKGVTQTEIAGSRKKKAVEEVKTLLKELLKENKIVKHRSRYFLPEFKKNRRTTKDYITRSEVEALIREVYIDIARLKERIDRAFEYVDEVFLDIRKNRESTGSFPTKDEMLIAYDNVNAKENAGDSVPIPAFKEELKRMGFQFDEEELNKKLLEMDKNEIIYLQEANDPEELENKEKGIKTDRGFLFYITWIKRS